MNKTYKDMSKEELITLVTRLTKQHDEWSEEAEQLREQVEYFKGELLKATDECGALWSITDMWSMCRDDYSMHDQYENLDERYADTEDGIILKELYTYTKEDGWQPKEMIE